MEVLWVEQREQMSEGPNVLEAVVQEGLSGHPTTLLMRPV